MILRARTVVTMNGAPIENGAVAISENRIIHVGSYAEVKARNAGEIIDLGEQALLPGLINAHCHLDYTCLRGKIAPQESFTAWIQEINSEKAKLSADDYLASIEDGFAEAQKFGTTTLVNLEAFPELIEQIKSPLLRMWWCVELIDIRSPGKAREIVDRAMQQLRHAVDGKTGFGLAPHAPFTATADLYQLCDETARGKNILLTTHLAESREETEMFREGAGSLFDFMQAIGRPIGDCGHKTPLEYLSEQVELDQRWIVAHANELTFADMERWKSHQEKFHIVHCPRSHRYFKHAPFPLQKLRSIGFNICLGTDSLASNSSLSLFAEMRALREVAPTLRPVDVIEMVTINSARALRLPDKLGQIAAGFFADLIAIPSAQSAADVFEEIVACENPVSWMMVDGKFSPHTAS
jgi:aminodeoxyfutalosine deaminase